MIIAERDANPRDSAMSMIVCPIPKALGSWVQNGLSFNAVRLHRILSCAATVWHKPRRRKSGLVWPENGPEDVFNPVQRRFLPATLNTADPGNGGNI